MGFSFMGTLIAITILVPNLLLIKFPPKNAPDNSKDIKIIFTILERIGQVACIFLLIISKRNFNNLSMNVYALLMSLCILIYYYLWIRYLIKDQNYRLLWEPLIFIPIPMAVFPVCAFAFAALLGKSVWLGIAVIFLAIGHLVNSWNSYKSN